MMRPDEHKDHLIDAQGGTRILMLTSGAGLEITGCLMEARS